MVFVDETGCMIHATVRKQLLYLFKDKIVEGEVYKMAYFGVVPNLESYRSAVHDYELVFRMKTKIQMSESSTIPLYGLSFTKCTDLKNSREESVYLVDVIGLVTGMSDLREYVKEGKVVKMTIVEVTDDNGKIECALFGEYAESLKRLMESAGAGMPVVVMQFLKQKIFRENSSLTIIMGTTMLLLNHDIPEVVSFKNGLAIHGVESSYPVAVLQARGKVSKEDDFLNLYPKRTIGDIKTFAEEGMFVVYSTVTGLVEEDEYWTPWRHIKLKLFRLRIKNGNCIADAWIRFAFDNTLRVGDKVCFSLDFDLNSLFVEIVKYGP